MLLRILLPETDNCPLESEEVGGIVSGYSLLSGAMTDGAILCRPEEKTQTKTTQCILDTHDQGFCFPQSQGNH